MTIFTVGVSVETIFLILPASFDVSDVPSVTIYSKWSFDVVGVPVYAS